MSTINKYCPFCGSRNLLLYKKINKFNVYHCKNCDLVYTDVTQKDLLKINNKYNHNYIKQYKKRINLLENRFRKHINIIEEYKKGGNILDIGCGFGFFLKSISKFAKYKWNRTGIDLNYTEIEYARKFDDSTYIKSSIERYSGKSEIYDVVTVLDVIEHSKYLYNNIFKISKLLKNKGLLVMQVPNRDSVMAQLCGEKWDWWAVPDHVYHFNISSIINVLSDFNFTIVKLTTWESFSDFYKNIAGVKSAKVKIGLLRKFFKITILVYTIFLWGITNFIKIFGIQKGGLITVYAIKNIDTNSSTR